ncbi:hypothetical protein HPB48_001470 [Haemaphysalis longicornis]|uniref:Uncharacterized protein n=1 Tax=Haemaphysalis longicornis TaxID=44386 RepID=A0A9J6FGQ1_HAELO|nr:hypothetical protein HPB48_001470 [Haemaphysalis longicornis]
MSQALCPTEGVRVQVQIHVPLRDAGLRLGLFTSTVFPMSGSSMEALAVSQCSCEESEPPPARQADTARAWLAAAACSGYSFFTWLPVVCAAVLYAGYMDQFPHVPRRDASWPFTIMLVIINVGGEYTPKAGCTLWTAPISQTLSRKGKRRAVYYIAQLNGLTGKTRTELVHRARTEQNSFIRTHDAFSEATFGHSPKTCTLFP